MKRTYAIEGRALLNGWKDGDTDVFEWIEECTGKPLDLNAFYRAYPPEHVTVRWNSESTYFGPYATAEDAGADEVW